jgi:hypothetical protein
VTKYKTFDEYIKGEKIVRYTELFKKCWDFATEAAEENGSSHNKQSTPCSCKTTVTILQRVDISECDNCGAQW